MHKLPHFSSKAFLAPMAGISDPAFRLLCKEAGAGLVVTELTSVHSIIAKEKQLSQKNAPITEFIEYSKEEQPVSVQLFGNDIDMIVKAAQIVEPYFDIIDFNMGCPAPHITQQMAGAALLQKPDHIRALFTKLVASVNKPVTLKVRAGINHNNCYLYKPIAKIAEECGVSMIALHARTLEQGYSGESNWSMIKELKELVNIPVIGNGDVEKPEDAQLMMEETGCDYVMIGRAARGHPWLFSQVNNYLSRGSYDAVSEEAQIDAFFNYLQYTKRFTINVANIRMQAMHFTRGLVGATDFRRSLSACRSIEELEVLFNDWKEKKRTV